MTLRIGVIGAVALLGACASQGDQRLPATPPANEARAQAERQDVAEADERLANARTRERERLESPARADDEAWSKLDVAACTRGMDDACYDVQRFWELHPNSRHADEARKAVADGGAISWKRNHPAETEADRDLAERVAHTQEAARKHDAARIPKDTTTAGHCCDGTAFSKTCAKNADRGCCAHHGGVCAERPPVAR